MLGMDAANLNTVRKNVAINNVINMLLVTSTVVSQIAFVVNAYVSEISTHVMIDTGSGVRIISEEMNKVKHTKRIALEC